MYKILTNFEIHHFVKLPTNSLESVENARKSFVFACCNAVRTLLVYAGLAFLPCSISYLIGTNVFGPMAHKIGRSVVSTLPARWRRLLLSGFYRVLLYLVSPHSSSLFLSNLTLKWFPVSTNCWYNELRISCIDHRSDFYLTQADLVVNSIRSNAFFPPLSRIFTPNSDRVSQPSCIWLIRSSPYV